MSQRLTFLLLLFLASLPFASKAWHIVGGELNYTCLGGGNYEVTLTIFRDCGQTQGAWFDNPASIGVFRADGTLVYDSLVFFSQQNDTLNPTLLAECFSDPPNVCVHTTTYTTTMFLPFIPGGYQLVYQRCCRNETIVNLVAPNTVGATYPINLSEEAMMSCNSSPKFNFWPPLYVCANQPFSIDQSATDADGDSLVYKLCEPFGGATVDNPMPQPPNNPPYFTVPWFGNYGLNDMLNGGAAGGVPMTIDPQTGLLTGTPVIIGQFVIGICIEEYRDGALLSVSRRDYQLNTGDCGVVTAAFFSPEILCDESSVQLTNQSDNAINYQWYFDYPNASPGSTEVAPTHTYSDTGTYVIALIAQPGTLCTDTFFQTVQVVSNTLFADFSVNEIGCTDSLTLQILDSSLDSAANVTGWEWEIVNGSYSAHSTEQNPVFSLPEEGEATLTLTVFSSNNCERTLSQTFPVILIDDPLLLDSSSVCAGANGIQLNPDGFIANATYQWEPAATLDNPSSPNPFASPDSTTTYSVTITDADNACVAVKEVTVIIPPVVMVTPVIDTILVGESVNILATFDSAFMYEWSPGTGLNATNVHDPVASPLETTVYSVTITHPGGCVEIRTVTIVVISICEEPYLFIPTGFSPNGDGKNDAFRPVGIGIQEVQLIVYNRWGEKIFETSDLSTGWDGTYKGKVLPPDAFGYYVWIRCPGGKEFVKKGNVTLLK